MRFTILGNIQSIHVQRWALAFHEFGFNVHVITQHRSPQKFDFDVTVLNTSLFFGYILNVPQLKKILLDKKSDLVHVHYAGGYGLLARFSVKKPYILTCYGAEIFDAPKKSFWHRWLIKKNIQSATLLTSSSKMMLKEIGKFTEFNERIHIVPFGVDTNIFKPNRKKTTDGIIKIGSNKHLTNKYGIDVLIEAFINVCKSNPTLKLELHLASDGEDYEKLKRSIADSEFKSSIYFHGMISHSEMPTFLNSLDIFCAPSRFESETFGVSILEASACELPVIVSDAGGLKEVCKHEITGFVVPKNSVSDLADAINKMIKNPKLRINMGDAGRKFVHLNYEWEKCVEMMNQIYKQMNKEISSDV